MIRAACEEVLTPERIEKNISSPNHELVILRQIIPREKITGSLTKFYDKKSGAEGKKLRMMTAVVIVSRFYQLSDRDVVKQVKENRYIQYFCNVADQGLEVFLHPSSLCRFRKRIGEKGCAVIEKEVFEILRRAGVTEGDSALTDPTVSESSIIYPNDVQLIHKAFRKMRSFAKLHGIPVWWDEALLKKMWREFGLSKGKDRVKRLAEFGILFFAAPETFRILAESLNASARQK
ncbi:MAG: transposase, partial [Desulfobacteraceae bacterium]|nr:transposase [Desulfobacteraceae bacterium]